ncbi:GAF domain-containing protein [Desulfopila aestuarii]|uniref:histidine kinase n=1 Tax=Desulfopila aestuarii DSM 18488 TaxID=1121416 RepID=A0A1M7YGF8_9BACT|nr:GAF domain-containing protein [Desulfopila aestuarii]SHO51693.1 PAS domain S-box-containing protein [Desulfopila aestuarii DSM 18488]
MESTEHLNDRLLLTVFQEVTRLISMARDPQEVMDLVVQRLPPLLKVDAATIRLLDESTNTYTLGAAHGVSDEYLSRPIIDSEEVMAELQRGHPTARSHLDRHCHHKSCRQVQQEGVKSALSLPILFLDKVIGILRLLTRSRRRFTEREINFAMSLAEQVGIALSRTRMFEEMVSQVKFLEALRLISKLVNSTLDLDRILTSIVERLPTILGVKACTIRLLQPATNRLELVAASGLSEEYLQRGSISREDSIFKVLRGEPVAIFDATKDPRVDYHEAIAKEGIKSILAIPIRNQLEIIGVLRLLTREHHVFTPAEIHFAMTVAEEGGNAIEKARTYRKINLLFNQIEEQERFLQTIMDSLWMQILVLSPDRRVVMANRMFLETHNMSEKEVLGKRYETASPWSSTAASQSALATVLSGKASVAILDQLDSDTGMNWLERHLTPVLDDHGEVEFVIEAVRNITDQKLLEQERLERVKLEGVIEMAGSAAHQLNSPLFAALGTAQLLRDDLKSGEALDDLDMIIRNLKEISELTHKMTKVTGYKSTPYVGNTTIVELK